MYGIRAILDAILQTPYYLIGRRQGEAVLVSGPGSTRPMPTSAHTKSSAPAAPVASATPVVRRRRRSTAQDPLKKITLRIHDSVASAIRGLVDSGEAASADAFIEAAIVAQLRERRRQRVYESYAAAAADTEFMADVHETERAFDRTVGDGLSEPEPKSKQTPESKQRPEH